MFPLHICITQRENIIDYSMILVIIHIWTYKYIYSDVYMAELEGNVIWALSKALNNWFKQVLKRELYEEKWTEKENHLFLRDQMHFMLN